MNSISATCILRAAQKYNMIKSGDKVLLGVSGGPDSVVLLHTLDALASDLGITLHIAHLNHGIRGKQSDLDEEFVQDLAKHFGIEITTRKVDIPSIKLDMHTGVEEAARAVRYSFLQETAANVGANKIAVGHNADDRAESVLLNLIRGAGVDGLGSIRPVRGNIIRPLIDTFRWEIEAYIKEAGIPFRIDESNADINYSRNRIRHELIPLLEENYNPKIKASLIRIADIASNQSEYLEESAQLAINQIASDGNINVQMLLNLPKALQYQIIRSEIRRVKGDLIDVTYEQVERVICEIQSGEDFTITLPSGEVYAVRDADKFNVIRKAPEERIEPFNIKLECPGVSVVPQLELKFECEQIQNPAPRKTLPNEVMIDSNAIVGMLRVRNLMPGDKIVPFGMQGTKKLQDVFVDKKIDHTQRAKAAIVVDDEKILWVAGIVASEKTRITADTKMAVRILVKPSN